MTKQAKLKRRRQRQISKHVQDWIEHYTLLGWNATHIYERMKKEEPGGPTVFGPSLRTVQSIVKEIKTRDTSGPWQLGDSEGEDAKLVLDVLVTIIVNSVGTVRNFTKAEARWIIRIAKAAPTAGPWQLWYLAQLYMRYENMGLSTTDLDSLIAFKPWESEPRAKLYESVLKKEWLSPVPFGPWIQNPPIHGLPHAIIYELHKEGLSASQIAELADTEPGEVPFIIDTMEMAEEANYERSHSQQRQP